MTDKEKIERLKSVLLEWRDSYIKADNCSVMIMNDHELLRRIDRLEFEEII